MTTKRKLLAAAGALACGK